jgi:capsular polysaccharide transport system ATP-binding protein
MIEFRNVTKFYSTPHGRKVLLDNFSMTIPAGAKVALIGRNGAGKSTMIGMISGIVAPNRGRILRTGTMSWPMGFSGSFAADITGRQNTLFVARIYGVDGAALIAFVEDFAELGPFIDMPVRSYSSGMKARLAFGMSMGLGFDWYLVDEVTSVGDTAFRKKSLDVFRNRLSTVGLIMVSHSTTTLREYCTSGIVLEAGRAVYYSDLEEAIQQHEQNMDNAFVARESEQDAEALYRESKRRLQNGDYLSAEEFLSRALAERPEIAHWHALLGEINRRLGNNTAALDSYQRALTLSNEARFHVARAQILVAEDLSTEAEDAFATALALEPDNVAASYALGRYLYRRGDVAGSEHLLLRVVAADPDNAGAHRVLAQINDASGNHGSAVLHHAHVARLMPRNAAFLLGYARSRERNGDRSGARETYAEVLLLDPKNAQARKAMDMYDTAPATENPAAMKGHTVD